MDTNSQIIIQDKQQIQTRKDLEFQKNLKGYLTKLNQTNKIDTDTWKTILSLAVQNSTWQNLIINNRFDINQASKIVAADWKKAAESMNYPNTIGQAIEMHSPSLAVYKKYNNETETIALVARMVIWTLKLLNVQKSQDDFQVMMTARMMLSEYYFLTLSELKYIFVRGIQGDYGQLYGKIDTMDLLRWLKEYAEQRSTYMVHQNQIKSKQDKQELKRMDFNPAFLEKVRNTINTIEARQKQKAHNAKMNLLQSRIDFSRRKIASYEEYKLNESLTNEQKEHVREMLSIELRHLKDLESNITNESQ